MLRLTTTAAWLCGAAVLIGCSGSGYAVRPVPRIAADTVGKPVSVLQEAFGEPRKVDKTSTKMVYVWFLPQKPKERFVSHNIPRKLVCGRSNNGRGRRFKKTVFT